MTTDFTAALGGFAPPAEDSTPNIRRIAEGRQHALATRDAAVGHVSAGAFWMIWRDGCNWALTSSAKMSSLFQDVAEQILMMSQARDAAPPASDLYNALVAIQNRVPLKATPDSMGLVHTCGECRACTEIAERALSADCGGVMES